MSAQGHPAASKTVKLALEGATAEKDGPFLRIQVPAEIGSQTMKTLHSRSLDLWRMHNGTEVKDLKNARVVLTFRDVENDLCYIFSEEDLHAAMPSSPQSLRVFARVEFPKPSFPMPELNAPSSQLNVSVPVSKTAATQTNNQNRTFSDIPDHKTVEAVIGVLTAASVALQKHVKLDSTEKSGDLARVSQAVSEEPAAIPFVHGRHTCDGCLTTPIVGKRFHAVNFPDYDLCATCRESYNGDEIRFEEVELECDVPFQERWNRRFTKWEKDNLKNQERKVQKMGHFCARDSKRQAAVPQQGPTSQAQAVASPPPRLCGGARHWNHNRFYGPTTPTQEVDRALKEAIRRSELDIKQNTKKENTEEKVKEGANSFTTTLEVDPASSGFDQKKAFAATPVVVPVLPGGDQKSAVAPTEAKKTSDISAVVVVEEVETKKTSEISASVAEEEEFVIPPLAPVGAHPAPKKDDVQLPVDKDSFSEDAAGNGDSATALGETMDAVVNTTNDFSAVLHSNSLDDAGEKSGLITRNSGEKEVVTTKESSSIILDGEDNQEDNESQNSWDVVNKDSDKQGEITDEVLARAAQVIGSALFESDITRSNTVNSNGEATNSTVSMLGSNHSISTSLPSVSSPHASQLSRWALQLKQLHELGFYDDGLNVEIMERMNAANIGSDLMEEVSVESVVNVLLQYW